MGTTQTTRDDGVVQKYNETLDLGSGTLTYSLDETDTEHNRVTIPIARQFLTRNIKTITDATSYTLPGAAYAEHHNRLVGLFDMWHLTDSGKELLKRRATYATAHPISPERWQHTYNAGHSIVNLLTYLFNDVFGINSLGDFTAEHTGNDDLVSDGQAYLSTREALEIFMPAATKIIRLHMQAVQQQWPVELGAAHAKTDLQIHQLTQQRAFAV